MNLKTQTSEKMLDSLILGESAFTLVELVLLPAVRRDFGTDGGHRKWVKRNNMNLGDSCGPELTVPKFRGKFNFFRINVVRRYHRCFVLKKDI